MLKYGLGFTALLITIFFMTAGPVSSSVELYSSPGEDGKLFLRGEIRGRYEYWNWFEPAAAARNSYGYGFQRSRLGLEYVSNLLDAVIEGQYTQMFNVPDAAFAPPPAGPLGLGGVYYANSPDRYAYGVFLRELKIRLKNILDSGLTLTGGRFSYSDGLEVMTKNRKINMVKKIRVQERLVGTCEWSAFARMFDGGRADYTRDEYTATAAYLMPTQGVWEEDAGETITRINQVAAAVTAQPAALIPGMEERLFYFYYNDRRDVTQRPDNVSPTASRVDIGVHTIGGDLVGAYEAGPGEFDLLLWGAGQFGDWYELDHRAYAGAIEAGYQFKSLPGSPWLRTGYNVGSGDDDPADGTHGTFFQMLPSCRRYSLFPIHNMMNCRDYFVMLIVKPAAKFTIRTDWHLLRLTERNDRWYSGTGATQKKGHIFGYLARPSSGGTGLANEFDLQLNWAPEDYLVISAYYGHIWGGEVIESIYPENKDADFVYLEGTLRF